MKKIYSLIIFLFIAKLSFATHLIAGQITCKWISGNTYEISAVIYTKGTGYPADRCTLPFIFGDGDSAIVCRSNFEVGDPTTDPWGANSCMGDPNCSSQHMGEWTLGNPTLQSLNIKKSVYTTTHTYPGAGTYVVFVKDQDFENGLINISDGQEMALLDTIKIITSPGFAGHNSNPVYSSIPIDTANLFLPFIYNPGAADLDGDSLSYSLIPLPYAPGYFYPSASSSFGINALTGDVEWNDPVYLGKYVFCVLTTEWKKNTISGQYYNAGSSMQIVSVRTVSVASVDESQEALMTIGTFPNPANSEIQITVTGLADFRNTRLEVFDHTGRKLKNILVTELPISLDTRELLNGMYFCRLTDSKNLSIQGKFEVTH